MCRCVGFLFGVVDQLVSRLLGRAINCSKQLHFDRVGHRVELNPMVFGLFGLFDLFALLWLHSHVWPFTTLKLFKGDAIELNCKVILDCTVRSTILVRLWKSVIFEVFWVKFSAKKSIFQNDQIELVGPKLLNALYDWCYFVVCCCWFALKN